MEQRLIKQLLEEAVTADAQRRAAIQTELINAVRARLPDSRIMGIRDVMDNMLVEVYQNRPDYLPRLLAFFLLVCGNHDEEFIFADIDWTLVD